MHKGLPGRGKMVHKVKKWKKIYWQRGRYIAKTLYYKEHIGDLKKKKTSAVLYAASIGNQINMRYSFLCWMTGQVVKRNRILLFQNLAMDMHPQKMQKKKNAVYSKGQKTTVLLRKSCVKVRDQQLCMKWGSKGLVGLLKVHHSLINHEIWNRYVNHNNIRGKYFVNDLFSVYEIHIYEILIF